MRTYLIIFFFLFGTLIFAQSQWALRPNESRINFTVSHFGWAEAKGSFKAKKGTLYLSKKENLDSIYLLIYCNTVNTGLELRDENIIGKDWLYCEEYPEIRFHTSKILKSPGTYDIQGILEIKGVKHQEIVPAHLVKTSNKIELKSFILVDRYDYGVGGSSTFPAGREIKLDINLVYEKK